MTNLSLHRFSGRPLPTSTVCAPNGDHWFVASNGVSAIYRRAKRASRVRLEPGRVSGFTMMLIQDPPKGALETTVTALSAFVGRSVVPTRPGGGIRPRILFGQPFDGSLVAHCLLRVRARGACLAWTQPWRTIEFGLDRVSHVFIATTDQWRVAVASILAKVDGVPAFPVPTTAQTGSAQAERTSP